MKKNIFYSFIVAILLSSCQGMDLMPADKMSDGDYWLTENDFKIYANGLYPSLMKFNGDDNLAQYDQKADLSTSYFGFNSVSNGRWLPSESDGVWDDCYAYLRKIHILLEHVDALHTTDPKILRYKGEALFFRAYQYFKLLNRFGDVPLVTHSLDIDSPELQRAQNPRGEVIDFVIQDLKDAIKDLPLYKSITGADVGRVSAEAAEAFLSRVALYEGTWQKFRENEARAKELLEIAANTAENVINGGTFSLFQPEKLGIYAYKYLFILENDKSNPESITKSGNTEYIFSRRYDEILNPIGFNISEGFLNKAVFMTRKMANMYLTAEGLPIDPTNTAMYATMTSEYENRDNRMQNIMMIAGRPYWGNSKGRTSWKDDAEDLPLALYQSFDPKSRSGYFFRKWATERKVASTKEGYDFPIIRYAEVLLNYAEALFELNTDIGGNITGDEKKIANGLAKLNLVRKRVNPDMSDLTIEFARQKGLTLRTEIRRERTIELFHEGFRMDDLKRWNTAVNEMNQNMLGVKWKGTDFEKVWIDKTIITDAEGCIIMENGRQWANRNYLYPLPTDQLKLNTNLKQNPGWE